MTVRRDLGPPALRPADRVLCIVMVCTDSGEADEVGRLLQPNTGYLITYRRAEDLVVNPPAGTVALVILATADSSVTVAQTLRWLRNRWPHCPVTVVGDGGSDEYEMTARAGGATYVVRPLGPQEWSAVLSQVRGARGQPTQAAPAPASLAKGD